MYINLHLVPFSVYNHCKIFFTVSGGAILKYFGRGSDGGGAPSIDLATSDDGGTGKCPPAFSLNSFVVLVLLQPI